MDRKTHSRRRTSRAHIAAGIALALTALPLTFGPGCEASRQANPAAAVAEVPAELRVSGPVIGRVHATGFQVYTWQPDDKGTPSWKLKAPDATFEGGGLKGKHYAGPTWENSADASKVVGKKLAQHDAPGDAVPWLLVGATSHEGQGALSAVTYIQRLNTAGGRAPSTPGATTGAEARIPYTADYVFYGAGATPPPAPH